MRFTVALVCLSLAACAPWVIDKPQQVADDRVQVCKKTGSRISRPCESTGSITQEQWDDVKATVTKPPPATISESRRRPR